MYQNLPVLPRGPLAIYLYPSFCPGGSFIHTESLSSVVLLIIMCRDIAVHLYSDIQVTVLGVILSGMQVGRQPTSHREITLPVTLYA